MRRVTFLSHHALLGIAVALLIALQGCTHFAIEDCGEKVLGTNEPRIRSSHFRMLLADLPAASNRFAPYASMSALVYTDDSRCDSSVTGNDRTKLESDLAARGWKEEKGDWVTKTGADLGLFFRVWVLEAETRQVVIAFQGTCGFKDWLYGNFHWLTRLLPMQDQYSQARVAARTVFDRFPDTPSKKTLFYTTGHSLGGGLAQHILYSYPRKITQAVTFDPSSVTGFVDQCPSNQLAACECSAAELNGEPRIFRVYDAYEVLANVRIFHKTFLPPERHIQEVRFPNEASHSIAKLADYLIENSKSHVSRTTPWYSGVGKYSDTEECTVAFDRKQKSSCSNVVNEDNWHKCPQ